MNARSVNELRQLCVVACVDRVLSYAPATA
jgi:hypothetical protein